MDQNIQDKIHQLSYDYVESNDKSIRLINHFQGSKMYEGLLESAPQACLQIAIILIQGKTSTTQLISVAFSFFSLANLASEHMMSMPTKGKEFKEASWKPRYLIFVPLMLTIVIPRVLCISLMISYLKEWIFLVGFIIVAFTCLACFR